LLVRRRALAGMIWSKQLYYYDVEQWLAGDPTGPPPPPNRRQGRNHQWQHLNNFDIISMPDGWEYPWYAAWDLAFHCIPLARIDPAFAKGQLELMTREWYMHPNGQLPAYEWALGDVNPPVHAWAARRVYEIDTASSGKPDIAFLERVFHKLLLNFTWWVNRKDADGNNVFQGGFLGLDNISLFDRGAPLPGGGRLDQSDGTAWMAFFTLEMLAISLELARTNPVYQDLATKFFEHFLSIATAMSSEDHCLWDPDDEFFYDVLRLPDGRAMPLRVRSMVGLIPLLAVTVIDQATMESMPEFTKRMHWFLDHRPHLSDNVAQIDQPGSGHRHLAALLTPERLAAVLRYLLDEEEFLSPYGIRSLSRYHRDHPYELQVDGQEFRVNYDPAESTTGLFGGNSNWRGPVWFPINFLIIEALKRFGDYCGDEVKVECPTGSGVEMTLGAAMQQVLDAAEGRFVVEDVHNFGADYDRTLMAWYDNFERAWPQWREEYGE
ncbi:MAG: glucosidase, partial [Acidimicrobiia bacterium]|nr:glucosidase [Acidimicrobiia bacterium]